MSINKIDARHRIKRSILTGVTPTVPPSNDFTDGTWLNTDIRAAEFKDAAATASKKASKGRCVV